MKKISLVAFYLVSLSIYSASAQSNVTDPYRRFIRELPGKLAERKALPSTRQRQYEVIIDGKIYWDFGFDEGETRFLYDPDKPDRLSLVVMSDVELGLRRRPKDINHAEDFANFDQWKAANLAAGIKPAPLAAESEYYDKFDRANGTIEFMGVVYTHRDLGGEGLSRVGAMIERSNETRRDFEKNAMASTYNLQIYRALSEINRALKNSNLNPNEVSGLVKRQKDLEEKLQTRHGDVIEIKNAIRDYSDQYRESGQQAKDERLMAEGERIRNQNLQYEAREDRAAAVYEAGRNEAYQFEGNDLKAAIGNALRGIKGAIHFSYGQQYAGLLTNTLSRDLLGYPVKNPNSLPVRPGGYIPGEGYTLEARGKYDESLENRKFQSFLKPANLVRNFSQLDLTHVPMKKLPSGENIVDISYIHAISEKIRLGAVIPQSEKDLMTALLVNFNDPRDFERLFSLVYSYEIRTKFEENLQRSVAEYSRGLSTEMLRLFLMSKINTHGYIFRRSSIESTQEQQDALIKNYEKIKNADRPELENLLKSALQFKYVNDAPQNVIVPLVFLKMVGESDDRFAKAALKMPRDFSEANARDVGEYVSRLKYLITLEQQNYQAFELRFGDQRRFSDWHDKDLPDITSKFMKGVFKVDFPFETTPRVRIIKSAFNRLQLPEYFRSLIEFERASYGTLVFGKSDRDQAKFLMKNSLVSVGASSSANSCIGYYRH